MSTLNVDKVDPSTGTALELGTSGDTVTVPSGVGLTLTDSTLLLPTTITSTTEVKTNKISPATGVAFTLGDSGDTFTVPSGATIVNSGTATGFGGDTPEDIICWGFEIMAVDTATNFTVNAGKLMHGSTLISKTADTTLTFATAGDWWDGATDSYSGGANWCYVGAKSNGDIKLLGNNPADKSDTASNTAGYPFLYWYDSSNYWRVIGAVYVNTSNQCGVDIKTSGRRASCQQTLIVEGSSGSYSSTSLAALCPKNVLAMHGNIGENGDSSGSDCQAFISGTNDDIGIGTNKSMDDAQSINKRTATDFTISIFTDQICYVKTSDSSTNYINYIVGWELP